MLNSKRPLLSNEIQGGILLLKVFMWLGWFFVPSPSFSNQSSQSVSISDAWRFLDWTWDIVVGVAELVGEQFNLVRWAVDTIVDDSVSCGSRHSLLSSRRDEVELIDVSICNGRINHCARHRILKRSNISTKDSGVHSLADVDVEQLGCSNFKVVESKFDLIYFRFTDSLDLTFTNSISVKDNSLGELSILFLECFQSF